MNVRTYVLCVWVAAFSSFLTNAAMTNSQLDDVLRANAPTNGAAGGCAIVYRVADGQRIAAANLGEVSPEYVYEPGSVVKPLTAIAAMEHGVAQLETPYPTNRDDPKYYRLPGDKDHVWPEKMSVADALVHSSNIVFGKLGADVGMKDLFATFSKFGIGSQGGRLPSLDHIDHASMSRLPIGQGLLSTPDEIARAYVILANRGKSPWTGEQIVPESTADAMAQVLRRVVSDEGTARRAAVEGVAVAGKTGTAQRVIDNRYVPLYNATFVGFFPAERPEYVIIVVYQTNPDGDRLYQGGTRPAMAFAQIATSLLTKSETLHVKDYRTNEVAVAEGERRYVAYFDSKIELPDFRCMPAHLVAQFVELATGQKTNDVRMAVQKERTEFFDWCRCEAKEDGQERFVHKTTVDLLYQDDRFVSCRINYEHYEGCPCGAALDGETTNVVFDCQAGKLLRASDVVSKENHRKLLNLIRKKLSEQFKGYQFEEFANPDTRTDEEIAEIVSWARQGDTGTPWVSDNFCITTEGMEWTYMPCEIVSAGHGTITVKVPWKDLDGIVSIVMPRTP